MAEQPKLGIHKFWANNVDLFSRPNLFKVRISNGVANLQENILINCFQATVPGLNIATTDKDKAYRSIAYQKIYEDITLGFYCSADMSELRYLQDWMNRIIRPQDNHVEYYERYAGTIEIINMRSEPSEVTVGENKQTLITKLNEAYPKSISSFSLDYGTSGSILNVTATFTYRDYTQKYGAAGIDLAGNVNDNTELSAEDVTQDPFSVIQKTGNVVFDSIGSGSSGSFDFNNQRG
tara:strand:+ start:41 stop:748 length:708 start_codon:yes stop_codon:yes gene_type:complete